MLNKDGIRELAYIVKVDSISPMDADRLECAHISGWNCVVGKGEFNAGDPAVYFEIDSLLPDVSPFSEMEFLKSKHFKVKSQKIRGVVSQGLLVPISAFGWVEQVDGSVWDPGAGDHGRMDIDAESRFVTEQLGVTYAVQDDNIRKSSADKYKSMAQRNPKFARTKLWRYLYKYNYGKKILFLLFGRKKDKKKSFPKHFQYIKQTDEERVENIPHVLNDKRKLIATEKLDGTSTTYILERKKFGKTEFYVLSRNVRQFSENQKCYHDSNIYWEMANKYDVENHLKQYLKDNKNLQYVCIQGESVGNVQGNPLRLDENRFYGFNFIRSDVGRISSIKAKEILENWNMNWVPIISTDCILPDTMEEMKLSADGKSMVNPDVKREGIVYRDENDSTFSFKNVSREYLLKHQ